MPDDLVKSHSATRKVDALNRSHRIPVGRERIVTGLVFLQVVANVPTVVVEKPRDGQWGCKLFIPLQIDPVVRRHTSPATRRRWFLNHLFVGLGYYRTTADTSLRCALRPVIVVGVEHQTSAHGFAHQGVPVMARLISSGTPKTSTEFPSRPAMPMLTLGNLYKDAVVVGVRIKHQGTTHKSLLLHKTLRWIITNEEFEGKIPLGWRGLPGAFFPVDAKPSLPLIEHVGDQRISSPFGTVSGRSHKETWAGCIVSLTTPTNSAFSASRSVSSLRLAEKASRVLAASYLRR